jgi:hypothetical protein
MDCAIVGAVVDRLAGRVVFVPLAREQQRAVQAGVEGLPLALVGALDLGTVQQLVPLRAGLGADLLEVARADLQLQAAQRLLDTDERCRDPQLDGGAVAPEQRLEVMTPTRKRCGLLRSCTDACSSTCHWLRARQNVLRSAAVTLCAATTRTFTCACAIRYR